MWHVSMFSNRNKSFTRKVTRFLQVALVIFSTFLTSCDDSMVVISSIDEREANLIVVFLESKGIKATKLQTSSGQEIGATHTGAKFNILVDKSKMVDALSILNNNGLPRRQGTNLLELFSKQGLMTSDKEETIRYQAGLAQQITNTILMIDGVIDASVQLSFPPEETIPGQEQESTITAAVYVKHQGIIDDPNSHLENKIKRIVSGSVAGLDINDVTVVSDRSRFTDITPSDLSTSFDSGPRDYVGIWNIVLSKNSAGKFRFLFFILTFLMTLFAILLVWLLWKFYPLIKKNGLKNLLSPAPFENSKQQPPPNQQETTNE